MNTNEFIWLDWVVLGVGLFAVIWAVWRSIQKDKKLEKGVNSEDYLFGKGEPWYVIGMAIFAANIGSEHLVGLAGTGAKSGVGMAHWEMQGWMVLILGWLFVPFYQLMSNKMGKIITMPDFLKYRYTKATGSWLSIITLVAYVLTKVSVTAFTGGIFLEYLLGLPFWWGAIGLILLTCVFTVLGGMKGVMTLSAIQTPILIVGSFLVLFLGLNVLGEGSIADGWIQMMEHARNSMNVNAETGVAYGANHMFHWEEGDPMYAEYPGFVVFIGASIIGFWYWCTDQHIVQRVLGQTKGESNEVVMARARRGTIAAGYFKILPVFMFLIPGMIAAALASKGQFDLQETDGAFAQMVKDVLPAGVKGIVTVGFICALVASLAAFFNSCATLFTEDFYKPMKKGKSEAHYVFVGRMATVVVVILGMVWIPVMMSLGSLYDYLQGIQSLLAPSMVAVFAMGIFFKKITPKAGEFTMIVGFLIGMLRLLTNIITNTGKDVMTGAFWDYTAWFWQTNWLVFEVWLLVFLVAFMIVVSFFTKKPTLAQIEAITFSSDYRKQIFNSWSKWDVMASLGVIALCAAFYVYFF